MPTTEVGNRPVRISGPISLYTFDVPCRSEEGTTSGGTNTVILAGDAHFSEALTCPKCREDAACATLCELIDDLERRALSTGTSFDVFLEFPYVVAKGRLRESVISSVDHAMKMTTDPSAAPPPRGSRPSSTWTEESSADDSKRTAAAAAAAASARYRLRLYADVAGRAAEHVRSKLEGEGGGREEQRSSTKRAPPKSCSARGAGAGGGQGGVGVFSRLYARYGDRVYGDHRRGGRRSSSSSSSSVRFHHGDARLEPNVLTLLTPPLPTVGATKEQEQRQTAVLRDWIRDYHASVPDSRAHRELMRAFLFGTDFVRDVERAVRPLGRAGRGRGERGIAIAPSRIVRDALSTITCNNRRGATAAAAADAEEAADDTATATVYMHKIAKQFHRLEATTQRPVMKAYLEARLDELTQTLRDIIGYDQVVDLVLAEAASSSVPETTGSIDKTTTSSALVPTSVDLMRDHRSMRVALHLPNFTYFMSILNSIVLMDAYLLCRLLRYATAPSSAGGVSFVYAGDAHIDYYLAFFEGFLGLRPRVSRPPVYVPAIDEFRRCVHV